MTRRNYKLVKTREPWRVLIEMLSDNEILDLLERDISKEEIENIGYYIIAKNRYNILKRWWNNDKLIRPDIDSFTKILISLQLFRLRIIKEDPLPILLTIIKSKFLRDIYEKLLNYQDEEYNFAIPNILNDEEKLRVLLIEIYTSIPNGAHFLYNEWKRYNYNFQKIWNIKIQYRHKIYDTNFDPLEVEYDSYCTKYAYNPVLQICRYGNVKDLKIALKLNQWSGPYPFLEKDKKICINPLTLLSINKNFQTFRYFMELIWIIRKICNKFRCKIIRSIIWKNTWLYKFLNEISIDKVFEVLSSHKINNLKRRVYSLIWLIPEYCDIRIIAKYFNFRHNLNIYHYYTPLQEPIDATPEHLLYIEKHKPLISPKIDGLYYSDYINKINIIPKINYEIQIQAHKIYIDNLSLYINELGKFHPYWKGPYKNQSMENQDFQLFLDKMKNNNEKNINYSLWWPQSVYCMTDTQSFFRIIDKHPDTIFKNDGWIICGNNGMLLKLKFEQTLDILYQHNIWYLYDYHNYNDNVLTEFPDKPLPKNLPEVVFYDILSDFEKIIENNLDINLQIQALISYIHLFILNFEYIKDISIPTPKIRNFISKYKSSQIYDKFSWIFNDNFVKKIEMTNITNFDHDQAIYDGIWKCIYIPDLKKWRPISKRFDKIFPDNSNTASNLIDRILYPWNPMQLLNYTNKFSFEKISTSNNSKLSNILKIKNRDTQDFIISHNLNIKYFINFGISLQKKYKSGFDDNPYIVSKRLFLSPSDNISWAQLPSLIHPITNKKYISNNNNIAIDNIIHSFARTKNEWKIFIENISQAKLLFISMTDADIIFSQSCTYFHLIDRSYIKLLQKSWDKDIYNVESFIHWKYNKIIYEPLISRSFLQRELQNAGWIEIDNKISIFGVRLMLWKNNKYSFFTQPMP